MGAATVGVVALGAAALRKGTPLFQTNFFPLLMQVNFMPLKVFAEPAIEHDAPAFGFGAAIAVEAERISAKTRARTRPCMVKD